ncbi:S-layer homology domain-containing protein [Helicovermis profundi]|uniref:SLH domain-containing protein n=1 Tax=Helicovermis profundi TaxID=3065157 RepID=A0AAU9E893_9FIRM|nr:hypothetical protein HLPR_27060 [Clostridia bacterium S502]
MKRVLSLVLALVLVLGTMPMAFADVTATSMDAGQTLKTYGLVQGDENGNLNEEGMLTRAQMMVVLARLLGVEDEAKAYAIPSTSTDVEGHWAAHYIAYAEMKGWTSGVGNGMFAPEGKVTTQQVAKFMLTALGYEANWATAVEDATAKGLMTGVTAGKTEDINRGQVFSAMLNTVNTPKKGTETKLGEALGVLKPEVVVPTAVAVKIDTAVALNSKVVEVALTDAGTMVDASVFTVKDAADKAIAVKSAKFAEWDTDKETVLLTLEASTTDGTLYTVTSGDTSANFGGKAADEDAPTVSSVTSEDYNQVKITFNEAVDLSTLKVSLAKKYGTKDALAVLNMEYDGNDAILLTTADQAEATLYSADITKTADLAGNVMDDDDTNTFVGTVKPSDEIKVSGSKSNDYNKVAVLLDQKVDAATVVPANFTIKEKYGDKKEVTVVDAALAADDDEYYGSAKISASTVTEEKQYVILTVSDLTDATLYEVTVKNVKSIYDTKLDTDNDTATFVGQAKPTDDLTVSSATSTGNNEVDVTFSAKVDEDISASLFTVKEKYGDKATLAVTDASVDGKVVTLTTADQKDATLYEITVGSDAKDIYGNKLDTDNDSTTFVGQKVADKIADITSITRNTDTTITVKFDQSVGDNATDVAYYSINNDIGYPSKAETVSGAADSIKLTIPKTETGTVYTLTVKKGIQNIDKVVSTDELTETFAGQGTTASNPKLEAAVVVNDQMMKLYFDKDVTDENLDSAALTFTSISPTITSKYEDPTNNKVLVLVAAADTFAVAGSTDTANIKVAGTDSDNDNVDFALNSTDADAVTVSGIVALNSKTLRVYFNQYVASVNVAKLALAAKDGTPASFNPTSAVAVNDAKTQYDFKLGTALTNETWTATITAGFAINDAIVFSTDADDLSLDFAGSADSDLYIDDVYAVMSDEQHVKVYYPEAMDEGTQTADYAFTNASAPSITLVEWNDDATIATLTLGSTYPSTVDQDTLTINLASVYDKAGVKVVESSDSTPVAITSDFGVSTASASDVKIDDLSATTAGAITVTFDQNVNATATAASDYTVSVNGTDVTVTVADVTASDDEVVLTYATGLSVDDVVKVTLNDTTNVKGLYDNKNLDEDNSYTTVVK